MFDWAGDEGDRPACEYPGDSMADGGEFHLLKLRDRGVWSERRVREDVMQQELPVDGQTSQHDGVRGHPS